MNTPVNQDRLKRIQYFSGTQQGKFMRNIGRRISRLEKENGKLKLEVMMLKDKIKALKEKQ